MKIALLYPPTTVYTGDPSAGGLIVPMGLAYIGAVCEKAGYDVKVFDFSVNDNIEIGDGWKYYGVPKEEIQRQLAEYKPDIVGIQCMYSAYAQDAYDCAKIAKSVGSLVVIGGVHPSVCYNEITSPDIDLVVIGEGEETFLMICYRYLTKGCLTDILGTKGNPPRPLIKDLDTLPFPALHLLPIKQYIHRYSKVSFNWNMHPSMFIISSRGCPYHCLRGDTVINTLDGEFKIKNLVGKENVKVLTRNKKTDEPEYANAYNISVTRKNAELVRVHFMDGTHIDCTPDHRFMGFKNGNQFVELEEREIEAKDLKHKQSVRAIKISKSGKYLDIVWGRRKTKKYQRLVMEGTVDYVEKLDIREDVYCMEVPGYDWFYANNVLVHNCSFCSVKSVWGRSWRGHGPKRVVDEIERLIKDYGVREVQFQDDNASADVERLKAICDELIRRKVKIRWTNPGGFAIWLVDDECLRKMKKSGCYRITFSIETAVGKTREYIKKTQIDLKEANRVIKYANKLGMWTVSNFIIGFPDETEKEIKETIDFVVKSDLDFAFFLLPMLFPHTEMTEDYKRRGLFVEGGKYLSGRYGVATKHFTSEQLNEIQRSAYARLIRNRVFRFMKAIGKVRSWEDLCFFWKLFTHGINHVWTKYVVTPLRANHV